MRKVNQSKKELHEQDKLIDFVNHASTLTEMTNLIENENEKVIKKIKNEGNYKLPSHEDVRNSNDNF